MIELNNLYKIYNMGNVTIEALKNITLKIEKGEFIAIMGSSGSGKSTLLNVIGCMDNFTKGEYIFNEKDISKCSDKELSYIRNQIISFVFQSFALMDEYTVYENIELPLTVRRISNKDKKQVIHKIAKKLGIFDQLQKLPSQISGGQAQRVGIARALASGAEIILADEPTGALDDLTSSEIMEVLAELNREGRTIIVVTHDNQVAQYAKRIIIIKDGEILHET